MTRLLIQVEGETEESFVNRVLSGHLYSCGYHAVGARLMGNARRRSHRGGITSWPVARREMIRHLREDSGCVVTTMIDYYGLPQSGERGWPGRAAAALAAYPEKAAAVETALREEIAKEMGRNFSANRFIPFVLMHEFEALLFSDCQTFASAINQQRLAGEFQKIRDAFTSPEEINDSPETAPSKRILNLVPRYNKPFFGTLAAEKIGLDVMRRECIHFHAWLLQLEACA